MPYASEKQRRLMQGVAHSPEFAKKVGISQSVGRKFETHKAGGGAAKESEMKESPAMMKKEVAFMKKKGAPKSMIKHEMAEAKGMKGKPFANGGFVRSADGVAKKGKTKAKQVKMAGGGKAC
jgi:hypothetical protein